MRAGFCDERKFKQKKKVPVMSCTALDILLLQPPDKPSGRHEEDGVWGWSVPLFAVWGAAWITRGQFGGV